MSSDKDVRRRLSAISQKLERDLHGEGGGGVPLAFTNPTLNVSSTSINHKHKHDEVVGSSEFIVIDDSTKKTTALEALKSIGPWAKRKARNACTKKMLYRRVPILTWLPTYNTTFAVGDLVAGITVALTLIPQALAYSNIAGVPLQYGLYGSFLGSFIYIIFGSCKDVPVGPTALISLLTFQTVGHHGPEHATLLCFFTGVIQVLMGLFGLGFLIDFVSGPVSSGFTSAAALIIITSQVRDVLGIRASGNTFVKTWHSILSDIHNSQVGDATMGLTCIIVLLLMRVIGTMQIGPKGEEAYQKTWQKVVNKCIWLFGTARNAILVVVCGIISWVYCRSGPPPFQVIGDVPSGLPALKLPPFGFEMVQNGTTVSVPFLEMMDNLGPGIIILPLIALLENIAICKAFSNGKPVDATQELIAIGLCNFANSFVQAFPGSGALARSAVNNSSGVRTTLGGLYTGIIVIVSLLFFTPYFYYIPKAALAGIIIAAVIFMVEVKVVKPMWRSKKSCLIVCFLTFIACLVLPLEIGILIGIGINLLFILYHAARPKISVERLNSTDGTEYLMLTPDRCLIFPSVDYVRNLVTKHSLRQGIPVVIDCTHIYGADYTAATVVHTLTQDFASRQQPLLFYNLKPSVCSVFEGLAPKDFIVFYDEDQLDNLLNQWSCSKKELEIMST